MSGYNWLTGLARRWIIIEKYLLSEVENGTTRQQECRFQWECYPGSALWWWSIPSHLKSKSRRVMWAQLLKACLQYSEGREEHSSCLYVCLYVSIKLWPSYVPSSLALALSFSCAVSHARSRVLMPSLPLSSHYSIAQVALNFLAVLF